MGSVVVVAVFMTMVVMMFPMATVSEVLFSLFFVLLFLGSSSLSLSLNLTGG